MFSNTKMKADSLTRTQSIIIDVTIELSEECFPPSRFVAITPLDISSTRHSVRVQSRFSPPFAITPITAEFLRDALSHHLEHALSCVQRLIIYGACALETLRDVCERGARTSPLRRTSI